MLIIVTVIVRVRVIVIGTVRAIRMVFGPILFFSSLPEAQEPYASVLLGPFMAARNTLA